MAKQYRLPLQLLIAALALGLAGLFGLPAYGQPTPAQILAQGPTRLDRLREAQQFFVQQRAPLGETTLDMKRYLPAQMHMKGMPTFSIRENRTFLPGVMSSGEYRQSAAAPLGAWKYLGPGNIGGRMRCLVIDPSTPANMYAAGVAGGVWKTTDAGASWQPLGDLMANLAVCSLVMDPTNPKILYAGTGEGYPCGDAVRGLGIFKTTDGGVTWTQLASTNTSDFYYVNDLKISPHDSSRVYAATGTGFFLSTDGGSTWNKTLDATSPDPNKIKGCMSIVVRRDLNPDNVIVSTGNQVQGGIYRSTDGGLTFTRVYTEANMGRTSLAIAPSNQQTIYALSASLEPGTYKDGLLAVFRSTDGGQNWTAQVRNTSADWLSTLLLSNPAGAQGCGGEPVDYSNQGDYDNVIAVDPLDEDIVWAGGIDLFRSDDGGVTWRLASYWWADHSNSHYAHADHHVIRFHPGYNGTTNKTMYVGNDGGLFRTDDARAATGTNICSCTSPDSSSVSWVNLNNSFGVTQFFYGAVYPDGRTFFGGTQDNGSCRGSLATGPNAWKEINGGDGGAVAVNPGDTNILFAETTNLSIEKSTDGGKTFTAAVSGITEDAYNFLFITPFVMDPNNAQTLWTGGSFLWRTTNGAGSWTQASSGTPGTGSVSALTVYPKDSNRVAGGMADGWIFYTTTALTNNSSTTWPSVQPVSGNITLKGNISSVTYAPNNPQILYATCSTFGQKHIWKSTDGGSTWAYLDGSGGSGFPDLPAWSLVVDPLNPQRLYVGSDLGIFVTTDGGGTWAVANTGFANVVTRHLVRGPQTNRLYAFTHGRSAWYVQLPRPVSGALDFLLLSN